MTTQRDINARLDRAAAGASTVPEEGFEMAQTRDELFTLCGKAADILYNAHRHTTTADEWNAEATRILGDAHHELVETYSWLMRMRWHRRPAEREIAA